MRLTLIALFAFALLGCEKNKTGEIAGEDFMIEAGVNCGWCAGNSQMIIQHNKIAYQLKTPCNDEIVKSKTIAINKKDFTALLSKLNWNNFISLQIEECGTCYDGCDAWYRVTHNGVAHAIRIDNELNRPALDSVRPFIKHIDSLLVEMDK